MWCIIPISYPVFLACSAKTTCISEFWRRCSKEKIAVVYNHSKIAVVHNHSKIAVMHNHSKITVLHNHSKITVVHNHSEIAVVHNHSKIVVVHNQCFTWYFWHRNFMRLKAEGALYSEKHGEILWLCIP